MEKSSKTIEVQVPLYGLEAVYKACYTFLDRAYIRLEGNPESAVKVILRPKEDSKKDSVEAVAGEFENELLHQALRVKVSASNKQVREYIVTRALLSAQGVEAVPAAAAPAGTMAAPSVEKNPTVLDDDLEKEIEKLLAEVEKVGSAGGDPLNISAPWEKKNAAPAHSEGDGCGSHESESGGGCCGGESKTAEVKLPWDAKRGAPKSPAQ